MTVKQAANVLELLEYFSQIKKPATASEVARHFGWPRSSAFSLLGTLTDMGYLYEPHPRGGLYPSPRWSALIEKIERGDPLPEALLRTASEITNDVGETTVIGSAIGTAAVFLDVVECEKMIRFISEAGFRVPIHSTAVGRAILGQYSQRERMSLYRKIKFEKYSETSLMSIDAVEEMLRQENEKGYHLSMQGYIPDLIGIAIPLPLYTRRLAIGVAGPTFRCQDNIDTIVRILQNARERFLEDIEPLDR